jgi:hypothetical protein
MVAVPHTHQGVVSLYSTSLHVAKPSTSCQLNQHAVCAAQRMTSKCMDASRHRLCLSIRPASNVGRRKAASPYALFSAGTGRSYTLCGI